MVTLARPWTGTLRRQARAATARSSTPWVTFCIEAHGVQANARLAEVARMAHRWDVLEAIVGARGWPDRLAIALERCLAGGTERTAYATEAGVSPATASADLRRLLDAGLVERRGTTRDARYVPSAMLLAKIDAG